MTVSSHRTGEALASPLRAFFVQMLVKDVSLTSAILDLVDNCIDGATRLRGAGDLDDLWVKLTISPKEFIIEDNCGGISVDIAKNYAFRFGRDPKSTLTSRGVGLFGVGMKRAIFKIGEIFSIESISIKEKWNVDVKVEEWLNNPSDSWTFPIEEYILAEPTPENNRGTKIRISKLSEGVEAQFGSSSFLVRLSNEIASRHDAFLRRHLNIKVNNKSVVGTEITFKYIPERLVPIHLEYQNGVSYRIFAGVSESDPLKAGWYIYCNGRMVVKADQTELTGWGELGVPAGGPKIPRMHHQYARFRGCTYFESDDPRRLPWKTTKDGIDVELPLYQRVKLQMQTIARPVINFLNEVDKENEEPNEEKRVLTRLLLQAQLKLPSDLPESETFHYIKPAPQPKRPENALIQFYRPKDQLEIMKKCLRLTSAKAVGEHIFDWYLENECKDV
jgi:hypothetical protein